MTTRTVAGDRWYLLHEGRRTGPGELERETAVTTGAERGPPFGQLLVGRYGGRAGVPAYGCEHVS